MSSHQNLYETMSLIATLIVGIAITVFCEPIRHGFYCNDETISLPYYDNTVTPELLVVFVLLIPLLIIFLVEKSPSWNFKSIKFYKNYFQTTFVFTFGFSLTYMMTCITKVSVGRLRPNFMSTCNPVSPNTNKSACFNPNDYVTDYICNGYRGDFLSTLAAGNQSQLSFFSGHSSLSGN